MSSGIIRPLRVKRSPTSLRSPCLKCSLISGIGRSLDEKPGMPVTRSVTYGRVDFNSGQANASANTASEFPRLFRPRVGGIRPRKNIRADPGPHTCDSPGTPAKLAKPATCRREHRPGVFKYLFLFTVLPLPETVPNLVCHFKGSLQPTAPLLREENLGVPLQNYLRFASPSRVDASAEVNSYKPHVPIGITSGWRQSIKNRSPLLTWLILLAVADSETEPPPAADPTLAQLQFPSWPTPADRVLLPTHPGPSRFLQVAHIESPFRTALDTPPVGFPAVVNVP
jgi:hypothetical protein